MLTINVCVGWQTYETKDNIYTPVRLFWKTVRPKPVVPAGVSREPNVYLPFGVELQGSLPSMSDYFGAYFKNHTNAFAYLNYTRDHNAACKR